MNSFVLGLAGALALAPAACSDDSDPMGNDDANGSGNGNGSGGNGGDACATDFSRLEGMTPSFRSDVMPYLGFSCAIGSSCHSKEGTPRASLYLGPNCSFQSDTGECIYDEEPLTDAIVAEVRSNMTTGLVGVPSRTAPSVLRVAPGDPANSFLVQKMLGIQNDAGHMDCSPQASGVPPCGDQMPNTGPALCESRPEAFETIVAWVLAGAPNN